MGLAPPDRREQNGQPAGLQGRVRLGELLRGGIEPTPQLLEGIFYEGKIHSLAGKPGEGKTLMALWAAVQVMMQGRKVLYLDAENGPKLIAERLRDMGASPDSLDEHFHYYPADLGLDDESLAGLMATVAEVAPAFVVFDSFADLLSLAGLEENSNDHCTLWMRKVAQPVKEAGSSVLILDHIPKGGKGPRGGGSKLAKVDVQWNLKVTLPFDRDRTGEIELEHDKDRECWLPKIVRFSVGGGVFARSAGTVEEPDSGALMTESTSRVFDAMRRKDGEGVRWKELLQAVDGANGTLQRALNELGKRDLFVKSNGRYRVKEIAPHEATKETTVEGTELPGHVVVPNTAFGTGEQEEGAVPQDPVGKGDLRGTTDYRAATAVPSGSCMSEGGTGGTTPLRGGTPGTSDAETSARYSDKASEEVSRDDWWTC